MQRSIQLVHLGPWTRYKVTPQEEDTLELPVTGDQIKEALFSVADDKAQGQMVSWPLLPRLHGA
ncbi:UNVERIFIED_CONTAM: hypothetical protein Sradi_3008800 [Sesamum radiatum]|uniref:Uncharacterized protein n=1 Tax=Sesamum radiatum TaxID=300843 RepID=A0AAW2S215_SESRA